MYDVLERFRKLSIIQSTSWTRLQKQ
jgi:hypothetical protein